MNIGLNKLNKYTLTGFFLYASKLRCSNDGISPLAKAPLCIVEAMQLASPN